MAAGDLEHLLRKAAQNGYIMLCWNRGTYRYYNLDQTYIEANSYESCVRLAAAGTGRLSHQGVRQPTAASSGKGP